MKTNYYAFVLFFLFIFSSTAQVKIWDRSISSADPNPPFPFKAEFRDLAVASDGKIYGTGFFRGNRAKFGNLMVHSDSALNQKRRTIMGGETETSFISCQSPNGDFLWVKSLVSELSINILSSDFLGTNLGTQISIGPDGNVCVAGFISGDTISFGGSVFYTNPQASPNVWQNNFFVLKINPLGNLVRGKIIKTDSPGGNYPRYLGFNGSEIELVLNHYGGVILGTDTITNPGLVLIKFDAQGNILSHVPFVFTNPVSNGAYSEYVLVRKMPDGKWVIGNFGPTSFFGCFLSILNPDFSLNKVLKIEMKSAIASPPYNNIPIWPSEILPLPQGKYGLVLGTAAGFNADEQLIIGDDTLFVGNLTGAPSYYRSLFVKLSDFNCMKKVEGIGYYLAGGNSISPNGNMYSIGINDMSSGLDSSLFQQFNRNGERISSLKLGKAGYVNYTNFEILGTVMSQFSTQLVNQDLYITHGQTIFKLQVEDNATSDESFNGCLSNRALALGTEKNKSEKAISYVSKTERGFVFHTNINEDVQYKLINSQGMLMEKGDFSGDEKELKTSHLSAGVYLLQVKTAQGIQSFKIVN